VPRLVVSKIPNHVETGGTAVYALHSCDLEKRAALDFGSTRVDQIMTGNRGGLLVLALER
jgi:hypothetical protein